MRSPISPSLSLARSRSRRSSSGIGAVMKIVTAPGTSSFTFNAPSVSSSSTGSFPASWLRTNSASVRNQYSRPSSSPRRRRRVVAETATSSSGTRSSRAWISVPFPAPEGPVTTKTGLPVEEPNQLCAEAIRQAANGLRLADAALVQEARRLYAAELRDGHQHVEHFGGGHVLRRGVENVLDLDLAE